MSFSERWTYRTHAAILWTFTRQKLSSEQNLKNRSERGGCRGSQSIQPSESTDSSRNTHPWHHFSVARPSLFCLRA